MNRNAYALALALLLLGSGLISVPVLAEAAPSAQDAEEMKKDSEMMAEGMGEESAAEEAVEEKGTLIERASYGIGLNFGRNLSRQGAEFDMDKIMAGLRDGIEGQDAWLDADEIRTAMQDMQKQWMETKRKEREDLGANNKTEGEAFLAENAQREGVMTTESGLQYEVLTEGDGAVPMSEDRVEVHYTGTLLDGTVFDSSHDRGKPAKFGVTRVIKGWTEALQMMPTGSKWKLYIPSDLAYGDRGAGANIGPNAALTFEVELLSIEETPAVSAEPVEPDGDAAGNGAAAE